MQHGDTQCNAVRYDARSRGGGGRSDEQVFSASHSGPAAKQMVRHAWKIANFI